MASVHDVAAAIIDQMGSMTAMKLQKLVYYCQAWHLVWEERPLFDERIEAWANGPVVPDLYQRHRGAFTVTGWNGDARELDPGERESIEIVLRDYGSLTASQLSVMTHNEDPWMEAREGLAPGQRSNREISLASMMEYYSSLLQ